MPFSFTENVHIHHAVSVGGKGMNRKTVSFVMTDPDVQQRLVNSLAQPAPPAQPRSDRGFIRNHFPHLRLSSHGEKKQRQGSNRSVPESDGFSLTQQDSGTLSGDDDSQGDSLSAVLLANAQPLSQRSGSLDRPPSLQRASLRPSVSATSKPLLDDANQVRQGEVALQPSQSTCIIIITGDTALLYSFSQQC